MWGNSLFKLCQSNNNAVDKNFPKFEEQHKKKGKKEKKNRKTIERGLGQKSVSKVITAFKLFHFKEG